ncbi:hypothetical protein IWW34DRAFT_641868 [Fusarium oxysporum f. sp. albedinis]|nr:hypothetical protein IWW34DRAFT_641868 [Fusarium oxysporum f. sp. albedinis]
MTESVAIEHRDAQKKLTHWARNREAQARRRSASKANEEVITVLRWGLRESRVPPVKETLSVRTVYVSGDVAHVCMVLSNGSVLSFQKVVPYYLVTKRGGGIRTLLSEQA